MPEPSRRPPHIVPPTDLPPNPPVPAPAEAVPTADPDRAHSPTRYGDWEKNGIAVDF